MSAERGGARGPVSRLGTADAALRRLDGTLARVLDGAGQPWWRRLAVCVLAALAVFLAMDVLRAHEDWLPPFATSWLPDEDAARDRIFRLASAGDPFGQAAPPVALVEIDDATFAAWERPLPLRRARLAALIARAEIGQPRAIVLDVDLAARTDPADEAALRTLLAAYAQRRRGGARPLPLLLARSVHRLPGRGGAGAVTVSAFDDLVGADGIAWVAPTYYAGEDGLVRDMPLFEAGCLGPGGPPLVLPSIQAALAEGLGVPPDEEARAAAAAMSCGLDDARARRTPLPPSGRILYHLVGRRAEHALTTVRADGRTLAVPVIERVSAATLLRAPESGLAGRFAGQVVIVGATHAASGDWQPTPLGVMPGPLVIANAVRSHAARGTIRPPALAARVGALVAASLLAWLLAEIVRALLLKGGVYNPATLKLVVLPMVGGALTGFDLWVAGFGLWSDLFVPQVVAVMCFTDTEYHDLRARLAGARRDARAVLTRLGGRADAHASRGGRDGH